MNSAMQAADTDAFPRGSWGGSGGGGVVLGGSWGV